MARSNESRSISRRSIPMFAGVGAATVAGNYVLNLLVAREHAYAYFAAEAVGGVVIGTQTRYRSAGAGVVVGALVSALIRRLTYRDQTPGVSAPTVSPTARVLGLDGPTPAPLPPPQVNPSRVPAPRTTRTTMTRPTTSRSTTTPRTTTTRPTPTTGSASSQQIATAQELLSRLFPAFHAARPGVMDTNTMRYLTTFQRTRGLQPTGMLDTATMRALQSSVSTSWPPMEPVLPPYNPGV